MSSSVCLKWFPAWFTVLIVILLSSCGGTVVMTPVDDDGTRRKKPVHKKITKPYHVVQKGDTLYSIAWVNGVDVRELAARNGVRSPYLIKPGQRIWLLSGKRGTGTGTVPAAKKVARYYRVRRGDTLFSIGRRFKIVPKKIARMNRIRRPYTIKPGQRLRVGMKWVKLASSKKTSRGKTRSSANKTPVRLSKKTRISAWRWPTVGAVIAGFSASNKGINIAGNLGQSINAVAGGRVVYLGDRLPGYGMLIIVKHNADYLSAYAHCQKTYVREGDVIKKGAKIAAMGSSGTDRIKLHFEIRYRGRPINPLRLLPKR